MTGFLGNDGDAGQDPAIAQIHGDCWRSPQTPNMSVPSGSFHPGDRSARRQSLPVCATVAGLELWEMHREHRYGGPAMIRPLPRNHAYVSVSVVSRRLLRADPPSCPSSGITSMRGAVRLAAKVNLHEPPPIMLPVSNWFSCELPHAARIFVAFGGRPCRALRYGETRLITASIARRTSRAGVVSSRQFMASAVLQQHLRSHAAYECWRNSTPHVTGCLRHHQARHPCVVRKAQPP